MIFLSLIMNLLLALGIGVSGGAGLESDVQAQHHFGTEGSAHGHTIHGHETVLHHGVHGHTVGPSGHANQNPHGSLPR